MIATDDHGRIDPVWAVFAAIALGGALVLIWLGRGMTFFADEWAFIESRALGDPMTWFSPHNEHWSTIPILVYRALVETVGLTSYVPYQGLVVVLHVVVVTLLFQLVRRSAGNLIAIFAATVLLFFGEGFENLYWGFQAGSVGATAAGLAALILLDAPARRAGEVALVGLLSISLMSQGIGLFFLAIVAVELSLRRDRRSWLPLLMLPTALYLSWFVAIGRTGIGAHRNPFTLDSLLQIPAFVIEGSGNAFGSVTGLGPVLGLGIVMLVGGLAGLRIRSEGALPPRFVAASAGIVVEYGLIALTRGGITAGQVSYTRYTYVSGILAVIAVMALVGPDLRRILGRPGRTRTYTIAASVMIAQVALLWNGRLLLGGRELFLDRAQMTRALITVSLDAIPAGVDRDRSLVLVPSPASIERIVAARGSPLSDRVFPSAVQPIDPAVLVEARRRLVEGAPVPGITRWQSENP